MPANYDVRYLAGIVLFNRGDFFEAHEAWEELWMETTGPDRAFFQGLIQAAVGLCHFCNGNRPGALKLYRSSKDYMKRYGSSHLGLDTAGFWRQMDLCYAELLANPTGPSEPAEDLLPTITLTPEPETWPNPEIESHG